MIKRPFAFNWRKGNIEFLVNQRHFTCVLLEYFVLIYWFKDDGNLAIA